MKVAVGMIVIAILVGLAIFKMGWLTPEDPKAAMAKIKAAVNLGMTWQEVVDIRQPRRFAAKRRLSTTGTTAASRFNPAEFPEAVKQGRYPEGFVFRYMFSVGEFLEIHFDANGLVEAVYDPTTPTDILQGSTP